MGESLVNMDKLIYQMYLPTDRLYHVIEQTGPTLLLLLYILKELGAAPAHPPIRLLIQVSLLLEQAQEQE